MKDTKKILAIDDEKVILDSIVKLCGMEGWKVDTALDANLGLKKVSHEQYDLIVSDIMMPQIDGFEFLDQLRRKKIKTPVIITTGFSTVENAVKSLFNGAIDFLPKPFTYDELISGVSRGLNYSELMKQEQDYNFDRDLSSSTISYIPCPPKYKRLGYSSWSFLEDDGSVKIGISDLFLRTIGTMVSVELFNLEDEIIQGNTCYQVKTDDQLVHNVLAPISGRILDRNEKVLENITLVEKDPYFKGWIYRIIPGNLDYESKFLAPCSSDRL